eukprot:2362576-Rhodomonas_salina.1
MSSESFSWCKGIGGCSAGGLGTMNWDPFVIHMESGSVAHRSLLPVFHHPALYVHRGVDLGLGSPP